MLDLASQHGKTPLLRSALLTWTLGEQGHIERITQQLGSALSGSEFTNNQDLRGAQRDLIAVADQCVHGWHFQLDD